MGGTRARRRLVAITGTVSALVALAWVVGAFDTVGRAVASPAGTASPLLFAIPWVTLLSIVGTTWYLLTREAHDSEVDDAPYVQCGSCGRSILKEWRLCPYCGSRVEPPITDESTDPT